MKTCLLISVVVAPFSLTNGLRFPRAPIQGYEIIEPVWTLTPDPELAPNVTIKVNGTIQQAIAAARAINPRFAAEENQNNNLTTVDRHGHEKRLGLPRECPRSIPHTTLIGRNSLPDFEDARESAIQEGAKSIRKLPGQPWLGAGPDKSPKSCSRISCVDNSAIWYCNTNSYEINLDTWNVLADSACYVAHRCSWWGGSYFVTKGMMYHRTGWAVEVKGEYCEKVKPPHGDGHGP